MTFVVAYLSWRWVESPFRSRRRVSRPVLIGVCTLASLGLLVVGATLAWTRRPPLWGRIWSDRLVSTLTMKPILDAAIQCGPSPPGANAQDVGCALDPAVAGAPQFMVVGDSHAGSLLPTYQAIPRRTGKRGQLLSAPGCTPLIGTDAFIGFEKCRNVQERALEFVRRHRIEQVFLDARWTACTSNDWANWIKIREEAPAVGQLSRLEFVRRLAATVDAYGAIG